MDVLTVQDHLSRAQRIACLMITGYFPTTPTTVLRIMLDLPPIHLLIRAKAWITNHRIMISSAPGNKKITRQVLI